MDSEKEIKKAVNALAKEEKKSNPDVNISELKKEILSELMRDQELQKKKADLAISLLERANEIMNGGGIKSIAMKFLMYFLLPLIIILFLGYSGYTAFRKKDVFIRFIRSFNSSGKYSDRTTLWRLKVKELIPDVMEEKDVENFNRVKEKMKEVYGI